LRIPLPNAGHCAHNAARWGFFPRARMKKILIVWWTLTKVVVAVFLVGWFALFLRRYDHLFGTVLPAWTRVPGFIFLGVGGFFILLCGALLAARGFGTPGNRFFPKEFIVFGPFRYVRNPMSLGAITSMFGLGLIHRSPSILLLALILAGAIHLIVIYIEEPGLEKRFGESYLHYRQSVNRWLPKIDSQR
jgi:protein-S-isoprenylcysteine O-methyltransferase Ste14